MSEVSASFIIISVILSSIVLSTIVGNVFVIMAILVDKNLQTTANQLVLSLAVADLMVACLVMPLGAYNDIYQGWYLSKTVCEFWTSADVLCCTASILNLLAIALDRYWAVTNVDYIYRRTRQRVNMMILCAWTVGAIVSLAPIFGWKDPDFAHRVLIEHKCMVSQDVAYQIFATISTFYAPLVILLALYWRIFQVARKRIRRKNCQKSSNAGPATTLSLRQTKKCAPNLITCHQNAQEASGKLNLSPQMADKGETLALCSTAATSNLQQTGQKQTEVKVKVKQRQELEPREADKSQELKRPDCGRIAQLTDEQVKAMAKAGACLRVAGQLDHVRLLPSNEASQLQAQLRLLTGGRQIEEAGKLAMSGANVASEPGDKSNKNNEPSKSVTAIRDCLPQKDEQGGEPGQPGLMKRVGRLAGRLANSRGPKLGKLGYAVAPVGEFHAETAGPLQDGSVGGSFTSGAVGSSRAVESCSCCCCCKFESHQCQSSLASKRDNDGVGAEICLLAAHCDRNRRDCCGASCLVAQGGRQGQSRADQRHGQSKWMHRGDNLAVDERVASTLEQRINHKFDEHQESTNTEGCLCGGRIKYAPQEGQQRWQEPACAGEPELARRNCQCWLDVGAKGCHYDCGGSAQCNCAACSKHDSRDGRRPFRRQEHSDDSDEDKAEDIDGSCQMAHLAGLSAGSTSSGPVDKRPGLSGDRRCRQVGETDIRANSSGAIWEVRLSQQTTLSLSKQVAEICSSLSSLSTGSSNNKEATLDSDNGSCCARHGEHQATANGRPASPTLSDSDASKSTGPSWRSSELSLSSAFPPPPPPAPTEPAAARHHLTESNLIKSPTWAQFGHQTAQRLGHQHQQQQPAIVRQQQCGNNETPKLPRSADFVKLEPVRQEDLTLERLSGQRTIERADKSATLIDPEAVQTNPKVGGREEGQEREQERCRVNQAQIGGSRSLDIKRKFRALGQLISFVQTSRQFNSCSSTNSVNSRSTSPVSQSAVTCDPASKWSKVNLNGGQQREQTALDYTFKREPANLEAPKSAEQLEVLSVTELANKRTDSHLQTIGARQVVDNSNGNKTGQPSNRRVPSKRTNNPLRRSSRENINIKREKKAAKTLAIITGVFVCCWLPFFLNAIIMPICGQSCTPSDLILSILLWLGYLNSLLNPIIYTIFSPDFRRAFRRLLCWPQLVGVGGKQ